MKTRKLIVKREEPISLKTIHLQLFGIIVLILLSTLVILKYK